MARSKTPSFIVELPVVVRGADQSILCAGYEAARQIYNACLGESLRRLQLKRQSKAFQIAKQLPKSDKAERQEAFRQVNETFGFQEYALHDWVKQFTKTWLHQHIDSSTAQKLASRAFKAVQDYAFGKHGSRGSRAKISWTVLKASPTTPACAGVKRMWNGQD